MSFIGVDIGTSFINGAILDLEKRELSQIRRTPFPDRIAGKHPLLCEFEPREIVRTVERLIRDLAQEADLCEGVVMCAQMHGLVLLNSSGEAVSNCISWQDRRALMAHPSGLGSYFDVLLQRISDEQRQQLGNELKPDRPISFLFSLMESGELQSGVMPVSIPDYVISRLCESEPGVETTNAGAYGAFNLIDSDWDHDVISQVNLDHLRWPILRDAGEIAGRLQISDQSVPCYMPVGDFQCALAGALLSLEELSLNIATGAQVSRLTLGLETGAFQTRPYFDGQFVNTFSDSPGGASLDPLVALVTEISGEGANRRDAWAFVERAVRLTDGTDLIVDFESFGRPGKGDGGRITNIRAGNLTVGHLFRTAFNAMAEEYYARALELWPEEAWTTLVFSGGLGSRLGAFQEVVTQRFQSKARRSFHPEDTLFGLLLLASVFSGRAGSIPAITEELRASHSAAEEG